MSWWRRKQKQKNRIKMRLFEATCRKFDQPNGQQFTALLIAESESDARRLALEDEAYHVTAIKERCDIAALRVSQAITAQMLE